MTAHNKLKIAILAIIASQQIHAITVDPIQIQSAPGELLYAEINFRNAAPDAAVQASLATPEDLISMGIAHQPLGHLNFFTRRNGQGEGVITITSSRPMTESELNVVIRIREGNAVHIQHVRKQIKRNTLLNQNAAANERTLTPVIIASEKDIPLNLPMSTAYSVPAMQTAAKIKTPEVTLPVKLSTPPVMNASAVAQTTTEAVTAAVPAAPAPSASASVAPSVAPAVQNSQVSADPLVRKYAESLQANNTAEPARPAVTKPTPEAATAGQIPDSTPTQHTVQNNESLWQIATRIANSQNRPVQEVMKQIKVGNEHAFIHGDANRLRKGVVLNLHATAPAKDKKTPVTVQPSATVKQSGKAKYRLNQAEMSLVAEKENNSAHGSAKKSTQTNQTSEELSLKVMTSREKTVKLQRNVTQLDSALRQKDHRIQLLNARLAQLQQQLKNQQPDNKAKHQSATN